MLASKPMPDLFGATCWSVLNSSIAKPPRYLACLQVQLKMHDIIQYDDGHVIKTSVILNSSKYEVCASETMVNLDEMVTLDNAVS